MSRYRDTTANYIQGAKGVISAADMFKTAVAGGDPGDIEFATDLLARAADDYAGNTVAHGRFGFDEIAATSATDLPKRERLAGDVLVSALVDLEVGNTLIAAGQVAGETAEPTSVETLDAATSQLNSVTDAVALPLGRDLDVRSTTARFAFDEVPSPTPTTASMDIAMAKTGYEERVTAVLTALVAETIKVLKAGFNEVDDLNDKQIAEAIDMVGKATGELPKIGRLITRGLQLVIEALQKLTNLLGLGIAQALQEYAKEIIGRIKGGGDLLDQFLNFSYGVAGARERVQVLLATTSADIATIDDGTKALSELETRFIEQMSVITRIVKGLAVGKRLVGKFLPEVTGILLFGAFYLVAMDCALLCGMDYADTATLITFVEGVIKISEQTLS